MLTIYHFIEIYTRSLIDIQVKYLPSDGQYIQKKAKKKKHFDRIISIFFPMTKIKCVPNNKTQRIFVTVYFSFCSLEFQLRTQRYTVWGLHRFVMGGQHGKF